MLAIVFAMLVALGGFVLGRMTAPKHARTCDFSVFWKRNLTIALPAARTANTAPCSRPADFGSESGRSEAAPVADIPLRTCIAQLRTLADHAATDAKDAESDE
jgi:hypothetical protein